MKTLHSSKCILLIGLLAFTFSLSSELRAGQAEFAYHTRPRINHTTGMYDSTYAGKVIFEALPRYKQETTVIVKHIVQDNTEKGIRIRYGNNWKDKINITPLDIVISGPLQKGKLITAVFQIQPQDINYLDLSFVITEASEFKIDQYGVPVPSVIYAIVRIPFVLDRDGNIEAIGFVDSRDCFTSYLGPKIVTQSDGLVVVKNPKPIDSERSAFIFSEKFKKQPFDYSFNIVADIKIKNDKIDLIYSVMPFHQYESGLAYVVEHNNQISVSEYPKEISAPLDSGKVYELSYQLEFNSPGIHEFMIGFAARLSNERYDLYRNGRDRIDKNVLHFGLKLFIGINEDNEIVFVTDEKPFRQYNSKRSGKSEFLAKDDRYKMVELYGNPIFQHGNIERYHSPGYLKTTGKKAGNR